MKKYVLYFSFCVIAVMMILLRPICVGATNISLSHPFRCNFNTIQRVIKKNDSHEDAIEITEIRQSASVKIVLPPLVHPYDFLLISDLPAVYTTGISYGSASYFSYTTYFQVTSRLRV
jgi:hypothetical protein